MIAGGVLGLLLLLGFVSLRLLAAAIFSLLYLLLAPAVALAPALGEPGRAAFRRWVTRLLGAVVSKLLFAFLLGVLLTVATILDRLEAVGWWTRWLLLSSFWWGTFSRRHDLLRLISGGDDAGADGGAASRRRGNALELRTRARERVRSARERSDRKPPELGRRGGELASPVSGSREEGGLLGGRRGPSRGLRLPGADGSVGREPPMPPRPAPTQSRARDARPQRVGVQERLRLIDEQRKRAARVGNTRRAALLASRARRVAAELADGSNGLQRVTTSGGERSAGYARFLEAQRRLPSLADVAGMGGQVRSYAAMAGIAGYARREYRELGPVEAIMARQQIDRELARGHEIAARPARPALDPAPFGDRGVDRGPHFKPPSDATVDGGRRGSARARPGSASRSESNIMKDARDVAAGRKRQLGKDTP